MILAVAVEAGEQNVQRWQPPKRFKVKIVNDGMRYAMSPSRDGGHYFSYRWIYLQLYLWKWYLCVGPIWDLEPF